MKPSVQSPNSQNTKIEELHRHAHQAGHRLLQYVAININYQDVDSNERTVEGMYCHGPKTIFQLHERFQTDTKDDVWYDPNNVKSQTP